MKRLLIATGLFAFTAFPVKAESWWLLLMGAAGKGAAIEKIEMASEEQCHSEGLKLEKSDEAGKLHSRISWYYLSYECVKGK